MKVTVEREIGGRKLSLTTGEIAKQASGAVLVQYGETVVLVAAQVGPPRPGIDFFPLTVDYRERLAAAGRFAGGFLKREGRPTTREVLSARLTDRPLRPLFPEGFAGEVQIQANVLACDPENDPDVHSTTGASAALCIAPIPFNHPIAAVRVGIVDGRFDRAADADRNEKERSRPGRRGQQRVGVDDRGLRAGDPRRQDARGDHVRPTRKSSKSANCRKN